MGRAEYIKQYVASIEPEIEILSSDEYMNDGKNQKIMFKCPICNQSYEKKWCHWTAQPKGKHNCPKCNKLQQNENQTISYDELQQVYLNHGLQLISSYSEYFGNHSRLNCIDANGYKHYVNLISLRSNQFNGSQRFSSKNPFAKENLQKYCKDNNLNIEILDNKVKRHTFWTLRCSCGEIFEATTSQIIGGRVRCPKCVAKQSQYELAVENWLKEHNISYEKEYRFNDCFYQRTLPFDFYIAWKNKIILIEVDGSQHYYPSIYRKKEDFLEQQKRDKIKTDYCVQNNYTLLRIPYWLVDTGSYVKELNKTFFG